MRRAAPGEGVNPEGRRASYSKSMGGSTFGYHRPGGSGIYWRRRLAVLCVGLAVLAAVAWAAAAAIAARAGTGHGAAGGAAGLHAGTAGGSGGPGSGQARHPGEPAASKGTGEASGARARPAATDQPTVAGRSPSPSPSARRGVLPPYCSRQDIVLSVFAGQASFGPGEVPSFSVTVVSTAPGACSFNLGPGYLALVIREGPVTIWNSADCVRGTGALLSALKRGVPTVLTMTWNRRTSSPGCGGPATRVPAGVYVAYAKQGGLTSPPVTFRLG